MRRATLLGGGAGLLAGAIACGVITVPSEPIAPVNACTNNASCAASFPDAGVVPQCFGGSCVGGGAFHPIVVVSVPQSPPSTETGLSESTFGLADTYQASRALLAPCTFITSPDQLECDFVPPLVDILGGNLRVDDGFGKALWPPGLRPNQPPPPLTLPLPTSLPIHATFRPMWVDPATGTPVLARKLGLPLDDRAATIDRATRAPSGTPLPGPTASTSTELGFVFSALVPQPLSPTDPSGQYQLIVVPDSPFDVFPPYIGGPYSFAPAETTRNAQLPFDFSAQIPVYSTLAQGTSPAVVQGKPYEVDELSGAPSLAGWQVHIDLGDAKPPTGVGDDAVRISGTVTLPAGSTKNIQMWWATGSLDQTNETLFIDPPPGVDLPRYFVQAIGSTIVGPAFPYPALPSPASISATVTRSDTFKSTTARVVFFANGDPTAFVVESDGVTNATNLLYQKEARTNDQDQVATTLPPGNLRAYVVPDADDLAITAQVFPVAITSQPTIQFKSLYANPRSHVRGRVVLPDGTPVFAADVVVDASADDPFEPGDDPLARPRESRATTDTDGHFDVLADPGLVDISIRPHDGTNLPWVVLTNRTVPPNVPADAGPSGGLTLASDVVVPLPVPFTQSAPTGVVTDSIGNTLPHAVVRAYAFPPAAGPVQTRGARLIGSAVADETGKFQLFVAPPQ